MEPYDYEQHEPQVQHNHPPRCCCPTGYELGADGRCPLCPEHGELASLGLPPERGGQIRA